MTRFLGIDYGTRRIGLAVGHADTKLSSPLTTVDVRGGENEQVRAILAATKDYVFDAVVVGLPLNMDGTEGKQAQITRRFGDAFARATGLPVSYWDERLSSRQAETLLRPAELTRKKKKARIDRVAAQVMLQSYLDAHE